MFPKIFQLGPITLHSYGLMVAIGFLAALYFMQRDARRVGVNPQHIADMAFWTLVLGVASTRLAHIIFYSEHYSWSDPVGWFDVRRGGLVFQGAIPTAVIYCTWSLRRRNLSFRRVSDIVMPYVPVGQAFGRVGCFLKGCCHGDRADELWWGISFPQGSPAYMMHQAHSASFPADATWSYPVHPTQLYSVLLLSGMCALLIFLRSKRPFEGITFPLYFILYGICRFIVEIFRGDGNPTKTILSVELSMQQIFCVGMIVFGIVTWYIMYRTRDKKADPSFPGKESDLSAS